VGTLKLGKGRVVVLGAILPQPTERFDHWFGLNPYTVSVPGQQLLLKALRWEGGPPGAALGLPSARRCASRRAFSIRLRAPRGHRLRSARVYVNGRRVRTRRGRSLRSAVRIRLRRRGVTRVTVVAVTRDGRRLAASREYRMCGTGR